MKKLAQKITNDLRPGALLYLAGQVPSGYNFYTFLQKRQFIFLQSFSTLLCTANKEHAPQRIERQ